MSTLDDNNTELFATLAKSEKWELQRHFFPSKLGGLPAWLDPLNLPKEYELKCDECSTTMTFVLQIYAPDDKECQSDAFHRTIFLFFCQPCGRQWKAFRCQLPRRNDYYEYYPAKIGTNFPQPDPYLLKLCCLVCGLPSEKQSTEPIPSIVASKFGVSSKHEGIRELHPRCHTSIKHQTLVATLEEWSLKICEGDIIESENYLSHEKALYKEYQRSKAKNGGKDELSESEEQAIENMQRENNILDKSFQIFCKKTTPNEVLYYCRDGEPLWTSEKTVRPICKRITDDTDGIGIKHSIIIPKCEDCGELRSFEFQVLPQLLFHIRCERMDFGSIIVYTCSKSCKITGRYKREFVFIENDLSLMPKSDPVMYLATQ